ncbi:MAG TPA: hypothetical protein VD994_20575 [Prosthecobacter sp.]|nr:hypothetical protein [Prosthecobacter sp.]
MKAIAQTLCLGLGLSVLLSSCYQPRPLPLGPPIGNPYVNRMDYDGNRRTTSDLGPKVDPRLSTENARKVYRPSPYVNRMDFDGDRRSHAHDAPIVEQVEGSRAPDYRPASGYFPDPYLDPYRYRRSYRGGYGYPYGAPY